MVVKDASAIDEAIVEAIIYDVMQQHLGPGTRLSEKSVCDRFGVSRMNVRRALLTLSNIGVVELQANKGARIRQPTLQQAMTLFETRRAIESIIIKSVVAQRSDADIVSLNAHVELEEQAFSNNDRHQLIRLSGEFHLLIASFQNNHLLTGFMQTLITQSSLITGMYGQHSFSNCPPSEHRNLIEAIKNQDEHLALNLMMAHLGHIEADLALSST
ncbi:MAG: GntR family transcriptional regulator [Gammaproteobacteria bacterium]|jgi:DNA-binding GntR family transcriptional regulator|tara:strand:+ start:457 stop:1101 length:645 start_codon:yes stop_codon:yes gene_type:complete